MSEVFCLPSLIDAEKAVRFFSRPRLSNLYGVFAVVPGVAEASDPGLRQPPFIERLWMPAYAIRLLAAHRKTLSSVWTSVDAWGGQCTLLDGAGDLVKLDLTEDRLLPRLDEETAVRMARHGLLRFTLSQRGQGAKPVVQAVEEIRPYFSPLWVMFYRRSNRHLDIKVLDAYTGKAAGAKIRIAVLNAFVEAKKAATG